MIQNVRLELLQHDAKETTIDELKALIKFANEMLQTAHPTCDCAACRIINKFDKEIDELVRSRQHNSHRIS